MRLGKWGWPVVLGVLLSVGACTQVPPTQDSPSPSSTSTPPETDRETADREAFAAVEETYLKVLDERNRLYQIRGNGKPTTTLTDFTTGSYLDFLTEDLQIAHEEDYVATNPIEIVGSAKRVGLSTDGTSYTFRVCEDFRKVDLEFLNGRVEKPPGSRLYLQEINVKLDAGVWKLNKQSSVEIASVGNTCES